jgi:hypothetical protein
VRLARPDDQEAIWCVIEPTIRAGETYPLASDREGPTLSLIGMGRRTKLSSSKKMAAFSAPIIKQGSWTLVLEHSLRRAVERGFKAIQFNFVVSTNERAVSLYKKFGFDTIGTLSLAFKHPTRGYVDVLVMFKDL